MHILVPLKNLSHNRQYSKRIYRVGNLLSCILLLYIITLFFSLQWIDIQLKQSSYISGSLWRLEIWGSENISCYFGLAWFSLKGVAYLLQKAVQRWYNIKPYSNKNSNFDTNKNHSNWPTPPPPPPHLPPKSSLPNKNCSFG